MKLKTKNRKKWYIIGAVLVAILVLVFVLANKKPKDTFSTDKVKKGRLVQSVSEAGSIKANKELELSFPTLGKISKILVKTGDLVKKDQPLMELDYSSLSISEKNSASQLTVAQANLNKLLAGPTRAELAVYEAQVAQAQSAYDSAVIDYQNTQDNVNENISQAQKKLFNLESNDPANVVPVEQAVLTAQLNLDNTRSNYQQNIDNNRSNLLNTLDFKLAVANAALDYTNQIINDSGIKNYLSFKNSAALDSAQVYYTQAMALKAPAQTSLAQAQASSGNDYSQAVSAVSAYLNSTYKTVNATFGVLENSVPSSGLTQAQLDIYKTNVNTHLTAVNVAISAVQTADYNFRNSLLTYSNNVASASDALKQAQANLQDATSNARNALATAQISGNQQIALSKAKMDNARESLDLAQTQLNKVRTPARSEDLSLAQAQVDQANSALSLIRKQISDNILKAPMDGQISKINYDIGEQLSGAKLPLSMITENNFEIEIDISESDISKLQLNNQATITFDAFGEAKKFNGIVYFIEPASTIIQGVTYYKVKVKLTDTADYLKDVKEGMTANVTISTATKDNVLMVPRRSIVDKNDSHILRVMTDDKNYQEIPVELGLSGDEGMIEIISNQVKEGDPIVISIKAGS